MDITIKVDVQEVDGLKNNLWNGVDKITIKNDINDRENVIIDIKGVKYTFKFMELLNAFEAISLTR
jgi:hypothetical protein